MPAVEAIATPPTQAAWQRPDIDAAPEPHSLHGSIMFCAVTAWVPHSLVSLGTTKRLAIRNEARIVEK